MRPTRRLASLDADVIAMDRGLDAFVEEAAHDAGVAPGELVSTDDNLYLEYATPHGNVLGWDSREALVREIRRHREESDVGGMISD